MNCFEVKGSMVSPLVHNTLQPSSGSKTAVTQKEVQCPFSSVSSFSCPGDHSLGGGGSVSGPSDCAYAHPTMSHVTAPCGPFVHGSFIRQSIASVHTGAPPSFTWQKCHCSYSAVVLSTHTSVGIGAVPASD